jgi:hypothetical protein
MSMKQGKRVAIFGSQISQSQVDLLAEQLCGSIELRAVFDGDIQLH